MATNNLQAQLGRIERLLRERTSGAEEGGAIACATGALAALAASPRRVSRRWLFGGWLRGCA